MRPAPIVLIAVLAACRTAPPTPPHPLAPLSAAEIRDAANLIRPRVPATARFSIIALDEPPKEMVLRQIQTPRRAFAILYDMDSNRTWEVVANLGTRHIDRLQEVPNAQPMLTVEDSARADQIVRADLGWQLAMEARGIRDLNNVVIVAWTAGYFDIPGTQQSRVVRAIPYYSAGNTRNYYAHPIEGLVAHVNLTTGKVLELLDTDRNVPVPSGPAELEPLFNVPLRLSPAPLSITQISGPGFRIENGEVRWEKWRFRYALHPREGLVLYTVGYEDSGRIRSIIYRGSLSEMVVPYGDPSAGWFFRNSFDAGELGLGVSAVPSSPAWIVPRIARSTMPWSPIPKAAPCPFPAPSRFTSGTAASPGNMTTRHAAPAIWCWATSPPSATTITRFDWIFHQNGTLEMRVGLTGVMAAKAVADGAHDPYSHMVGKNLAAPHHQHFFTFRLDMDVDGPSPNRVVEMNSVPVPTGPTNPYGGAFQMEETELRTEAEAQRNLNLATSRKWIVTNPSARNPLGHATGYALLPGENAVPFAQPDSWVRKRAALPQFARLGDSLSSRRNLRRRRLPQPEPRRRRPAPLGRRQPQPPQPGRSRVVHHGNHP